VQPDIGTAWAWMGGLSASLCIGVISIMQLSNCSGREYFLVRIGLVLSACCLAVPALLSVGAWISAEQASARIICGLAVLVVIFVALRWTFQWVKERQRDSTIHATLTAFKDSSLVGHAMLDAFTSSSPLDSKIDKYLRDTRTTVDKGSLYVSAQDKAKFKKPLDDKESLRAMQELAEPKDISVMFQSSKFQLLFTAVWRLDELIEKMES
jgi:hypothetical protein